MLFMHRLLRVFGLAIFASPLAFTHPIPAQHGSPSCTSEHSAHQPLPIPDPSEFRHDRKGSYFHPTGIFYNPEKGCYYNPRTRRYYQPEYESIHTPIDQLPISTESSLADALVPLPTPKPNPKAESIKRLSSPGLFVSSSSSSLGGSPRVNTGSNASASSRSGSPELFDEGSPPRAAGDAAFPIWVDDDISMPPSGSYYDTDSSRAHTPEHSTTSHRSRRSSSVSQETKSLAPSETLKSSYYDTGSSRANIPAHSMVLKPPSPPPPSPQPDLRCPNCKRAGRGCSIGDKYLNCDQCNGLCDRRDDEKMFILHAVAYTALQRTSQASTKPNEN